MCSSQDRSALSDLELGPNNLTVPCATGECTPKHNVDYIDHVLRTIPMQTPEVDLGKESQFSSRVWWREAVRTLHRNGIIHCPDVDALEREARHFAGTNDVSQSPAGYKYFVSRYSV